MNYFRTQNNMSDPYHFIGNDALESLKKLEIEMERSMAQVRNGIKALSYDSDDSDNQNNNE